MEKQTSSSTLSSYAATTKGLYAYATFELLYSISTSAGSGGSVAVSDTSAVSGATITVTATPNTGYRVNSLYYTDSSGTSATIYAGTTSDTSATAKTFTMPASDVTVYATFTKRYYTASKPSTITGGTLFLGTSNSSISSSSVYVQYGSTVYYKATPTTGYYLSEVTYGSSTKTYGTSYTSAITGNFTMPASNVTVTPTYSKRTYTVSLGSVSNGKVATSATSVVYGNSFTFTATPNTGYYVSSMYYTNSSGTKDTVYTGSSTDTSVTAKTVTMPASNVTLYATFTARTYTISTCSPTNGTIATSANSASYGSSFTVTATPDSGYYIDTVYYSKLGIGGIVGISGDSAAAAKTYTVTMPYDNVLVCTDFAARTYTVSKKTVTGATITLSATSVKYGDDFTVSVAPTDGYYVDSVYYTNSSGTRTTLSSTKLSGQALYTVTMPASNLTVGAVTSAKKYKVSKATINNGSITVSSDSVYAGSNFTATVTPDANYYISRVYYFGNGTETTVSTDSSASATTYSITMPGYDVTVYAVMSEVDYTISYASTSNGTLTGPSSAKYGESFYVYVTPASGYEIDSVYYVNSSGTKILVTSTAVGYSMSYGLEMPAGNITVYARFKTQSYTITYLDLDETTGTATGPSTGNYGSAIDVTLSPATGYEPLLISYSDGGSIEIPDEDIVENSDGTYTATFTMPAQATVVTSQFSKRTYALTYTAIGNGTITGPDSAEFESEVSLTGQAITGYSLTSLTLNGEAWDFDSTGNYGFTASIESMPASDLAVVATYTVNTHDITVNTTTGGYATLVTPSSGEDVAYGTVVYLSLTTLTACTFDSLKITTDTGDSVAYTKSSSTVVSFVMPDQDVIVTPYFSATKYDIKYTANDYATLEGPSEAEANEEVTVTVTPVAGYAVSSIRVAGSSITVVPNEDSTAYYGTFNMPGYSVTVTAGVSKRSYVISYEAVGNGSVTGTSSYALYGASVRVTAVADSGYRLLSLTINGDTAEVTESTTWESLSRTYTTKFTVPDSDVHVVATFEQQKYRVILNELEGGTMGVDCGDSAAFGDTVYIAIKPDEGFSVVGATVKTSADVTVESWAENAYFVFVMPASEVYVTGELSASHLITYYNMTPEYGTLAGDSATQASTGSTVLVTATPNDGYELVLLTRDGSELEYTEYEDGSAEATFTMGSDATTITAMFAAKSYEITYDEVDNGSVVGASSAVYGNTVPLTITPDEGYMFESFTLTDESGVSTVYTDTSFTMPASDVNVSVKTVVSTSPYTITLSNLNSAYGELSAPGSATYTTKVTIAATAYDGYELASLSYYGVSTLSSTSLDFVESTNADSAGVYYATFEMPAENIVVVGAFTTKTYEITYEPAVNGSMAGVETAAYGQSVSITVTPSSGYELESFLLTYEDSDGETVEVEGVTESSGVYTFAMPAADVTASASFHGTANSVVVEDSEGGTIEITEPESCVEALAAGGTCNVEYGAKVSLSIAEDDGYTLTSLTAVTSDGTAATVYRTSSTEAYFYMADGSVTVKGTFAEGGYKIYTAADDGTTIDVVTGANEGDVISFTVSVDDGYTLNIVRMTNEETEEVTTLKVAGSYYTFTMPDANVTISTDASENSYNVTCSVTPDGAGKITCGSGLGTFGNTVEVSASASTGYKLSKLTVAGTKVSYTTNDDGTYSYELTMPASDVEILATFIGITNSIEYASVTGGVVTGISTAATGDEVTVTATAASGYTFTGVTVTDADGDEVDDVTCEGLKCTFTMPTSNATVTGKFSGDEYTITASMEGDYGESTTLTVQDAAATDEVVTVTTRAESGYKLTKLVAAGKSLEFTVDESGTYTATFTMPSYDATVVATYAKESYDVYYPEVVGGSVRGTSSATYLNDVTVISTASEGYLLAATSVKVVDANNNEISLQESEESEGTYTFTMPDTSVYVYGVYEADNYKIEYAEVVGGTASGNASADYLESVSVKVAANEGYTLNWLLVKTDEGDTVEATAGTADSDGYTTYTFEMPASNVTVTPICTVNSYEISYSFSPDESGEIDGPEESDYSANVILYVTANEGYTFSSLSVDGSKVEATDEDGDDEYEYSFAMPAHDVAVVAYNTANTYTITVDENSTGSAAGGTVTYSGTPTFGETITVTTVGSGSNTLSELSVTYEASDGSVKTVATTTTSSTTHTFTMPAGDVTIYATFAIVTYPVTYAYGTDGSNKVGGSVYGSTAASYGEDVTVIAVPADGYEFVSMTVGGTAVTVTDDNGTSKYTFEMGTSSVAVVVTFKAIEYTVSYVYESTQGTVTGGTGYARAETATFTVTPKSGYQLATVVALDALNNPVTLDESETVSGQYSFTVPANNVTVTVTFSKVNYAITYNVTNGSYTGASNADYLDEVPMTFTPDEGYEFSKLVVAGTDVTSAAVESDGVYSYTLEAMPAGDVSVIATFSKQVYTITYSYDETQGSIEGDAKVEFEAAASFTVTPATGFELASISAENEENAAVSLTTEDGYTYTLASMPASNVTVKVTFNAIAYTITYESLENGILSGPLSAYYGNSITFTGTPNEGYEFSTLYIDGEEVSASSVVENENGSFSCTFTMPNHDVEVSVVLTERTYTITDGTDKTKGSLDVQTSAAYGSTVEFTASALTGYEVASVAALDAEEGIVEVTEASDVYSFVMPFSDVTVTATLNPINYAITYEEVTGGTASGPEDGDYLEVVTFTFAPDSGYSVAACIVNDIEYTTDCVSNGDGTYSLEFTMPAGDVVVSAEFETKGYNITYDSGLSGIVAFGGNLTAKYGATVAVTALAQTGYTLGEVFVTDADSDYVTVSGSGSSYAFIMPASDVTVSAGYTANVYTLTYSEATGGTVTGSTEAAYTSKVVITATPEEGYTLGSITINGAAVSSSDLTETSSGSYTYVLTMPANNVTVGATFTGKEYEVTCGSVDGGTVTCSSGGSSTSSSNNYTISVATGSSVTVVTSPDTANLYEMTGLEAVYEADGDTVEVKLSGSGGTYSFTMPAKNVEVTAEFSSDAYKITTDLAEGTNIYVASAAREGDTVSFTVSAESGRYLDEVKITSIATKYADSTLTCDTTASNENLADVYDTTYVEVEMVVLDTAIYQYTDEDGNVGYDTVYTETIDSVLASYTIKASCWDRTNPYEDTTSYAYTDIDEDGVGTFIMPASSVTITTSLQAMMYALFSSVDNPTLGSVLVADSSGTAVEEAAFADSVYVTAATVKLGYDLESLTLGGTAVDATLSDTTDGLLTYTYTFAMPDSDVVVRAEFTERIYSITTEYEATEAEFVTVNSEAAYLDSVTVYVSAAEGYNLGTVTLVYGDTSATLEGSGTYGFIMPASDVTVKVEFEPKVYTITYAAVNGGTLSGPATGSYMSSVTVTATADPGYSFATLSLAGTTVEPLDYDEATGAYTYTFTYSYTSNLRVSGSFSENTYKVTAVSEPEAGGTVTATGTGETDGAVTAKIGEEVTFEIEVNDGYSLSDVAVACTADDDGNNTCVEEEVELFEARDGSYSFDMPAGNAVITATFDKNSYTITYVNASDGSSVTGVTSQTFEESVTASVNLNDGYLFKSLTVTYVNSSGETVTIDEVTEGEDGYTFAMPAGNVTVTLETEANTYTIATANEPEAGGSITVTGSGTDESGNVVATTDYLVTFSVEAKNGYTFSGLTATYEDSEVGTVEFDPTTLGEGNYSFTMPAGNVTLAATYVTNGYDITYVNADVGGTVTGAASQNYGETVTVTVTLNSGYSYESLTATYEDSDGDLLSKAVTAVEGEDGEYTFEMPAYDVTVTLTTTADLHVISYDAGITGGSVTSEPTGTASTAETVTVTPSANAGYVISEVIVTTASGESVTVYTSSSGYTFTMPAEDVTISASFVPSGEALSIASTAADGITVVAPTASVVGNSVTFSLEVDSGYVLTSVTVYDSDGNALEGDDFTDNGDGSYTFTMPGSDATIVTTSKKNSYTVATNGGTGVTITVADEAESYEYQSDVSFSVAFEDGYSFGGATVTDASGEVVYEWLDEAESFTFEMPASNVTINVPGSTNTYKVVTAPDEGSAVTVNVDNVSAVPYLSTVEFVAEAKDGYTVSSVVATYTSGEEVVTLTLSDSEGNELAGTAAGTYTFTMPTAAVTITVTSTRNSYEITSEVADGLELAFSSGVSVDEATTAVFGDAVLFTVGITDEGYSVGEVAVYKLTTATDEETGEEVETLGDALEVDAYADGSYGFEMPAAAVKIVVANEPNTYKVATSAAEGSVITVNVEDTDAVEYNSTVEFAVAEEDGYTLASVVAESESGTKLVEATESGSYSFTMPAEKVTITATVTVNGYEITYELGDGLEIDVASTAEYLSRVTFTTSVTDTGYTQAAPVIYKVETATDESGEAVETLGDTVGYDALKSGYRFYMPASKVKIVVESSLNEYSIASSAETGVELTAQSSAVYKSTVTLASKASSGYTVAGFTVTNDALASEVELACNEAKDTCTFEMPSSSVTVVALASANLYEVAYEIVEYSDYGTVYLNGSTEAIQAETASEVVVQTSAKSGYKLTAIYAYYDANGDGDYETDALLDGNDSTYSLVMPAAPVLVTAAFGPRSFSITYDDDITGGTVSGSATAYVGFDVTVTATAEAGYELASFVIAGETVTDFTENDDGTYSATFTMPATTVEVSATFTTKAYNVGVAEVEGGTVSVTPLGSDSTAVYGTTLTVSATTDAGYALTDLEVTMVDTTWDSSNIVTIYDTTYAEYYDTLYWEYTYSDEIDYDKSESFVVYAYEPACTDSTENADGTFTCNEYAIDTTWVDDCEYDEDDAESVANCIESVDTTAYAIDEITTYWVCDGDEYESEQEGLDCEKTIDTSYVVADSTIEWYYRYVVADSTPEIDTTRFIDEIDTSDVIVPTISETEVETEGLNGAYSFTMPAGHVIVKATFTEGAYTISLKSEGDVSVNAPSGAVLNQSVSFTVTVGDGYKFDSLSVTYDDENEGTVVLDYTESGGVYNFTMPAANVTINVYTTPNTYGIEYSLTEADQGSVDGDVSADCGGTAQFTVTAASGYAISKVTAAMTATGTAVAVTDLGEGSYSFEMPAGDVVVSVVFVEAPYNITYEVVENGTVSGASTAYYGSTVTLFTSEEDGYAATEPTVTDADGNELEVASVASRTYSFVMPASDVTVVGNFRLPNYVINYAEVAGGAAIGADSAAAGEEVLVTACALEGYGLSKLTVEGNELSFAESENADSSDCYYATFEMPDNAVTVIPTFAQNNFTITYEAIGGGTATGPDNADVGDEVTVTATAEEGYALYAILVDGEEVAATESEHEDSSGVYYATFTMTANAVTVTATFVENIFAITYTAVGSGTVTGVATASEGDVVTITATPDEDYELLALMVAGDTVSFAESEAGDGSYTASFEMPATAVAVVATFIESVQYSITYSATGEGTATGVAEAAMREEVTVTATANGDDYALLSLTVAGSEVEFTDNGDGTYSYTFSMPSNAVYVVATFVDKNHTITYSAIGNGSVTGEATADLRDEVAVSATAESGYSLLALTVDGEEISFTEDEDERGSYAAVFTMPASDVKVVATFVTSNYSISYSSVGSGSVTGASDADLRDEVTVTATADSGYILSSVVVAGEAIEFVASENEDSSGVYYATFTMPSKDVTVLATFTSNVYAVSYYNTGLGSFAGAVDSAEAGSEVTVTAVAGSGYILTGLTIAGEAVEFTESENEDSSGVYYATFTMPTADVAVIATFTNNVYAITYYNTGSGSFAGALDSAEAGSEVTVTAVAGSGSLLTGLTIAGEAVEFTESENADSSGVYYATFTMPTADVTIIATFTKNAYDITYYVTGSGSVDGVAASLAGDTISLTVVPSEGYVLLGLTATGASITLAASENEDSSGVYYAKFVMPASDVSVVATFTQNTYNIVYSIDGSGDVDGTTTAYEGQQITVYATAEVGGELTSILVAGEALEVTETSDGEYQATFTMPASDVTVEVKFTDIGFAISYAAAENGEVTGEASATYGSKVVVTATGDVGYAASEISVVDSDGNALEWSGSNGVYYFTMPSTAVTVSATFEVSLTVTGAANDAYDITLSTDSTDLYEIQVSGIEANVGNLGRSTISTQNGVLRIYSNSAVEVRIYSLKGALVTRRQVSAGESVIGNLKSGVYMIRLSDGTRAKVSIH